MNVWAKMMTALRGGINETGEAIIDSQALRILDQEVRDASEELKHSKNGLAEIMARKKLSEEKCNQFKKDIAEYEEYVIKALDKKDDELAHEVAEKIAGLENQHIAEQSVLMDFTESVDKLRAAIKQADRNIKHLKQQVDTVKAAENVQRAQAAVADRYSGTNSRLVSAMDSLERIKEKQKLKAAQINAGNEIAEEMSDCSLQDRLEKAGISQKGMNAEDVLKRLKKQ